MKALKIIGFVLIGLVFVVAILSFALPTEMKSERSIVINAPKAVIFEQLRLFANTRKWSPWEEKDSNIKTNIAGTDGTIGAIYSWEGNDDVGKGTQTITKIEDQKRVDIKLNFLEPMESEAGAYYTLEDDPGGVKVAWGFDGKMPRPWNVLSLFMSWEKGMNEDFDKGLARLKELAEKAAASPASGSYEIKESTTGERMFVGIRKEVPFKKISDMFMTNMPRLMGDAQKGAFQPAGPPAGLYFKWDTKAMTTDMAVAVPVMNVKGKTGAWQTFTVNGGKTLTIDYYGAYDKTEQAHHAMDKYIADHKYKQVVPVIEEYITDPATERDTSKWLTRIIYFVE